MTRIGDQLARELGVTRYRIAAAVWPLLWLAGICVVLQLSANPHSWVYAVWGEAHPAWDLLTATAGMISAGLEGAFIWKGWIE